MNIIQIQMISSIQLYYLLPHILHPTRATDHSATIIDNMSSNITDFETKVVIFFVKSVTIITPHNVGSVLRRPFSTAEY